MTWRDKLNIFFYLISMNIFTIAVLGNRGVGKTTYLKRITTGEFIKTYEPTTYCEIYPPKIMTTIYNIRFIIKDIDFDNIESYINDCCGFIILYEESDKNIDRFITLCAGRPYAAFQNKYDFTSIPTTYWNDNEISMKTNTNFELPLINLLRKIMNDNNINYYNPNDYGVYDNADDVRNNIDLLNYYLK
jgi:GTP-binding nuclear protein Ran